VAWLIVALVSLYPVLPSVLEMLSSRRRLTRFSPLSLVVMFVLRGSGA
jgi:hypothetical protein